MTSEEQRQINGLHDKMDNLHDNLSDISKNVAIITERVNHLPTMPQVDQRIESSLIACDREVTQRIELAIAKCSNNHNGGKQSGKIINKENGIRSVIVGIAVGIGYLIDILRNGM